MEYLMVFKASGFRIAHLVPLIITLTGTEILLAGELTVARYSTLRAAPTEAQADLLAVIVNVSFPESVARVGEALNHLLQSSGYRLASAANAHPTRPILLRLPLPDVHRTLGPMPLRVALETLAGPAFRLVVDPVHRLVSFERCMALSGVSPAGGQL